MVEFKGDLKNAWTVFEDMENGQMNGLGLQTKSWSHLVWPAEQYPTKQMRPLMMLKRPGTHILNKGVLCGLFMFILLIWNYSFLKGILGAFDDLF